MYLGLKGFLIVAFGPRYILYRHRNTHGYEVQASAGPTPRVRGMRFRVWGLGFGVWGLGFRVFGLGFGV